MTDPCDMPMDELYVVEESKTYDGDSYWITFRQGGVSDGYWFSIDRSGRCFRMGQVDPNTGEVDQIHICNGPLFHRLLGDAIAEVERMWGDD